MSEYMLHSNFGKTLTRVICGNFGSYNLKLLLPYFLNICLPFWMFYKWKEYLNKIKNSLEFRQTNSGRLVLSPYSYRIWQGLVKTNPNGQNSARET